MVQHQLQKQYLFFIFLTLSFVMFFLGGCTYTPDKISEDQSNRSQKVQIIRGLYAKEPAGKTLSAKIVKVIDGDTIQVELTNGNIESIRLLLIDTPETVHPSKPQQPFGKEASTYMKNTLPPGSTVIIEMGISERDKYGRLLAYVYNEDEMINAVLLQKGLARVAYIYPPNTKYIDELYEIQSAAQKKSLGIWSIENYVTESGYNSSNNVPFKNAGKGTSTKCSKPEIKGNISSKGEKIYHTPSGQYYKITKPEQWFCTENEAIEAGFRKSKS
ncbi:thermonuclease family protein [Peribacillus alkalitolerans]|uniref:thermonuclease family protein n=1 Tax=Peribacillus alkalitolerans TaxID=1550385 RepID=UPI001F07CCCF|nr:thermonuclease family protein [Peribacillus alkalitolerans]